MFTPVATGRTNHFDRLDPTGPNRLQLCNVFTLFQAQVLLNTLSDSIDIEIFCTIYFMLYVYDDKYKN
jgi:hypothetical protein